MAPTRLDAALDECLQQKVPVMTDLSESFSCQAPEHHCKYTNCSVAAADEPELLVTNVVCLKEGLEDLCSSGLSAWLDVSFKILSDPAVLSLLAVLRGLVTRSLLEETWCCSRLRWLMLRDSVLRGRCLVLDGLAADRSLTARLGCLDRSLQDGWKPAESASSVGC